MTDPDLRLFFTRPISGTLLFLALLSFVLAIYQEHRSRKIRSPAEEH